MHSRYQPYSPTHTHTLTLTRTVACRLMWLRQELQKLAIDAETLFTYMDCDGSNSVGKEEFSKGLFRPPSPHRVPGRTPTCRLPVATSRPIQCWRRRPRGDGVLVLAEMACSLPLPAAGLKNAGIKDLSQGDVNELYGLFDTGGDGNVTWDEIEEVV